MADAAHMSLALLYGSAGSHPASWLHRESRLAPPPDLASYASAARTAERGLFDLFFIADTPAARTENLHAWSRFPMFMNVFEPVTLPGARNAAYRPRRHRLHQLLRTL